MSEALVAAEGATFTLNDQELTVGPKCTEDISGNWICTTCSEAFPHNFAMQSHVAEGGDHVLAWNCHAHGPEVP